MKYCIRVKNKNNGMNCFIYHNAALSDLRIILLNLTNLDTNKYYIEIKNEEEK